MVASHASFTGDLVHNSGMCPDWESNRWPFGSQSILNPLSYPSQGGPEFFIFSIILYAHKNPGRVGAIFFILFMSPWELSDVVLTQEHRSSVWHVTLPPRSGWLHSLDLFLRVYQPRFSLDGRQTETQTQWCQPSASVGGATGDSTKTLIRINFLKILFLSSSA